MDEAFKGLAHAVVGTLATMMGLYNGVAYQERRERRNLINILVYGTLLAFEVYHVQYHVKKIPQGASDVD